MNDRYNRISIANPSSDFETQNSRNELREPNRNTNKRPQLKPDSLGSVSMSHLVYQESRPVTRSPSHRELKTTSRSNNRDRIDVSTDEFGEHSEPPFLDNPINRRNMPLRNRDINRTGTVSRNLSHNYDREVQEPIEPRQVQRVSFVPSPPSSRSRNLVSSQRPEPDTNYCTPSPSRNSEPRHPSRHEPPYRCPNPYPTNRMLYDEYDSRESSREYHRPPSNQTYPNVDDRRDNTRNYRVDSHNDYPPEYPPNPTVRNLIYQDRFSNSYERDRDYGERRPYRNERRPTSREYLPSRQKDDFTPPSSRVPVSFPSIITSRTSFEKKFT